MVVRIGFNTTCYSSPSGTPTEVCLEIVNNIRLIMNKSMVLLAVDGSCRQTGVTFMNGDTTGSRACISIESFPMNVSIPNPPCQSISLLQRCQSETEESRQTVNFQQSTALSCISNEVGFCPAENNTSNGTEFIWLRTPIGTNATFRCPNNQSFSVTRACMACTGGGVWQTFDQQGCGVLTNQLDAILASSRSTEETEVTNAARMLSELITESVNHPIDQTRQHLNSTRLILNNIAKSVQMKPSADSMQIVMATTQTVGSLGQWMPSAVEAETSSSIVQSFETISSVFAERLPSNSTRSFSFKSVTLITQRSDLEDLRRGRSISIYGENFTIEDEVTLTGSSADTPSQTTTPTISLPPLLFQQIDNATSAGLVFTLYGQSTLFPVGSNAKSNHNGTTTRVGTTVIAATVVEEDATLNFENLKDPVLVLLPINADWMGFLRPDSEVCVSWDFDRNDWTRRGCNTTVGSDGTVLCTCDHLTNFAVLVDVCSRQEDCEPINPVLDAILSYVSNIGIVLSIIGLILTIITMLAFKKIRRKDTTSHHVQLCLSLLLMMMMALVQVAVSSAGEANVLYGGCIFTSITFHYFTLVAVMWMAAEAVLMFQKLIIVFVNITVKKVVIVSLICWMVPIIPVLATLVADQVLGQDPNNDLIIQRSEKYYCFLSHPGALWGAFLGPILLVVTFNLVIFICIIVVQIRHIRGSANKVKQKMKVKKAVQLMFSIGGIMAIFGLSWLFAILTVRVSGLREIFQILFTVGNSFQGFYIFLFFCVLNKQARKSWRALFSRTCGKIKKWDTLQSSLLVGGKQTTVTSTVEMSSAHQSSFSPPKTEPKVLNPPNSTSYTHVPSDTGVKSPLSPSASKPGKVLGLDDVPETSTFHITPSKTTFIT